MEFQDKFNYEGDLGVYSSTGQFTSVSYSPPGGGGDGQYAGNAGFAPRVEGQDIVHTTDFMQSGSSPDVYTTFPPNVQAIVHPLESFAQYS